MLCWDIPFSQSSSERATQHLKGNTSEAIPWMNVLHLVKGDRLWKGYFSVKLEVFIFLVFIVEEKGPRAKSGQLSGGLPGSFTNSET